jgi:CDP-glucose 4,6-dehydratase
MHSFWHGKRVLITGHTGFKGGWLSLWLQHLGAEVIGYALQPPTNPSLFEAANLEKHITSIRGNILDRESLADTFEEYKPEIVFHLAAQPIVRKSYTEPIDTFNTNIMGTVNLLDVVRTSKNVKVVVNVTSDKCYENKEWAWGYRETEPMGGHDPYSCSKGCSELITNSFRKSFFSEENTYLASARAGNVIGGGDWAEDRLVPDIMKSLSNNQFPVIRNPYAIRPWQHVLEPLSGYMLLAEKLWNGGQKYAEGWNFGPENENIITVSELLNKLMNQWGINDEAACALDDSVQPHEAQLLKLDSSKAKYRLNWSQTLTLDQTLGWTVDWYQAFMNHADMYKFTMSQIEAYERLRKNQ